MKESTGTHAATTGVYPSKFLHYTDAVVNCKYF